MNCSIEQVVGCAEERGMDDVVHYVQKYSAPDFNMITDCGFPVCYGEKGILEVELQGPLPGTEVRSFHSGSVSNIVPDLAVAELAATPAVLEGLDRLPEEIQRETRDGAVLLTAHGMAGHAAFPEGSVNAAAKLCRAMLDAGLLVGQTHFP